MRSLKQFMAVTVAMTTLGSQAVAQTDGYYQLAVIKDTTGYGNIVSGRYERGLEQLARSGQQSVDEQYENAMSLCAANIKLGALTAATKACESAVSLVEQSERYRDDQSKFKALALNNRAIVKYLNNDHSGAYQDFNQAISLNDQRLITVNYQVFASKLATQQFATSKP